MPDPPAPMRERAKGILERFGHELKSARHKGSFARNALYTSSDALVTILAQVILTPLVARIYGPEAYGVYGLFLSITLNLSTIAGLAYPNAFVLPREEERFHDMARGSLLILLAFTVLSVPFFFWHDLLFTLAPSWSVLGNWLYAIPFTILVLGLVQIFLGWATRVKAFSLYAKIGPGTNLSLRFFNLAYGTLSKGSVHGLMLGEVLVRSLSVGAFVVGLKQYKLRSLITEYRWPRIKSVLLEFKNYPLFIFPSRWLALFATQLPIFGLTTLRDPVSVGQFALASGLLLMPLRLLGYSLSAVFLQKAAEVRAKDPAEVGMITQRLYVRLMMLGVVPFAFITFFGDAVFALILGDDWRMAGTYSCMLGLFYFFRLLSEPLVTLYSVMGQERKMFSFYAVNMVANLGAVLFGTWVLGTPTGILMSFCICNTVLYLYLSARILHMVGRPWATLTVRSLLILFVVCLLFAVARQLLMGSWWVTL